MIRITILTFSRDAALSLAALRCVRRRLPDAAVTVADDGHDPVTAEVAAQMQALGARYVQTDFPRRGNLNGSSCVRGILETLLDGTADDDVAIKLDADTVLRSDGPVRRMLAAGAGRVRQLLRRTDHVRPVLRVHGCRVAPDAGGSGPAAHWE